MFRGRSSSGRAPPCQGGGSEFEPRRPLQRHHRKAVPFLLAPSAHTVAATEGGAGCVAALAPNRTVTKKAAAWSGVAPSRRGADEHWLHRCQTAAFPLKLLDHPAIQEGHDLKLTIFLPGFFLCCLYIPGQFKESRSPFPSTYR